MIAESDRIAIKNEIVQLMITVPEKIQFQISDALTLIAAADFPDQWEGLLPVKRIVLIVEARWLTHTWYIGNDYKVKSNKLSSQQWYS